jgi:hypothetical protein
MAERPFQMVELPFQMAKHPFLPFLKTPTLKTQTLKSPSVKTTEPVSEAWFTYACGIYQPTLSLFTAVDAHIIL